MRDSDDYYYMGIADGYKGAINYVRSCQAKNDERMTEEGKRE